MQNIFRNKMRSFLTMLGVTIGVASVMAMVTIGTFAKEKILSGYAELGANTIKIYGYQNWRMKASDHFGISYTSFHWQQDIEPLYRIFPEIQRLSPALDYGNVVLSYGGKSIDSDASVNGVNQDVFSIAKLQIAQGKSIQQAHVDNTDPVCVIGPEIVQRLFAQITPLGEILSISESQRTYTCKIIGVLSSRSTRSQWRRPDLEVFLPYTYFQRVSGNWWAAEINRLYIQLKPDSPIERTGHAIQAFFERKYGKSGYFRMDSDSILIEQMTKFLNIFSGFLAAVASVSLLVGGVGITNMMLVSVSERLREIGLRKALGATDESVYKQFLLESLAICAFAGLVGIIIGFAGYETLLWLATRFIKSLEFAWIIDPISLVLSLTAIIGVGVISGLAPALRARNLSPMQALRTD